MLLNTQESTAQTHGIAHEAPFKINNCPHLFNTLVKNLYKNPTAAVLREILSNAYDAQERAGTETTPIEVTLPTYEVPNLVIKDVGTGLSHEDIFGMYSTLFASDKQTIDNELGAYGLGAKSPLAITDQFTVTSRYYGTESTYSVYRDNIGIPKIVFVENHPTTDHNGLTITIPIQHITDVHIEAKNVLPFFNTTRNEEYSLPPAILEGKTFKILNHPTLYGAYILLGPVLYPIQKAYNTSKCLLLIDNLQTTQLEITPNKEDLLLTERTKNHIEYLLDLTTLELNEQLKECQTIPDFQLANNKASLIHHHAKNFRLQIDRSIKHTLTTNNFTSRILTEFKHVKQFSRTNKAEITLITISNDNPVVLTYDNKYFVTTHSATTNVKTKIAKLDPNIRTAWGYVLYGANYNEIQNIATLYDLEDQIYDLDSITLPPPYKKQKTPKDEVALLGQWTSTSIDKCDFTLCIDNLPVNYHLAPSIYSFTAPTQNIIALGNILNAVLKPKNPLIIGLLRPKQHHYHGLKPDFVEWARQTIQTYINNNSNQFQTYQNPPNIFMGYLDSIIKHFPPTSNIHTIHKLLNTTEKPQILSNEDRLLLKNQWKLKFPPPIPFPLEGAHLYETINFASAYTGNCNIPSVVTLVTLIDNYLTTQETAP